MTNKAFTPAELASNIAFQAAKKASPKVSTTPAPLQSLLKPKVQQSQATFTNNIPKVLPKTGVDLWALSRWEQDFAKAAIEWWFKREDIEAKIQEMRAKNENKPNIAQNAAWGLLQAAAWWLQAAGTAMNKVFNAADKYIVDPISRWLWVSEDKIQKNTAMAQQWRQELLKWASEIWSKVTWADSSSTAYQVSKLLWDIWQLFIPTWEWAAIAKWVSKIPKIWAFAKWALEVWANTLIDAWKYAAISEQRLPTKTELAVWWAFNTLWRVWWAVANKLQLSWLLNPKDLRDTAKALHAEKEVWNVWKWMLDRWMIGSKDTIIDKVGNFAAQNYDETQRALSSSSTVHKVPEAQAALTKLKTAFWWDKPELWLEDLFNEVNNLYKKSKKWLTLKELDQVQKLQWEYLPNFIKAWSDVKDTLQAKANANLYNKVKTFIEEAATKEWIGNIKELKKNTQIAYMVKNAIVKKEAADYARQLLSPFAGWALWWISAAQWDSSNPVEYLKKIGIWVWIGALANNKAVQSNLANIIYKAWWAAAKAAK